METEQRQPGDVGASATEPHPEAHKFIVKHCSGGMNFGCDEAWGSIRLHLAWNRKHTGCVHVGAAIGVETLTVMSAKDAIRSNWGFLCNAVTPAAGARGPVACGDSNEHPWGGKLNLRNNL